MKEFLVFIGRLGVQIGVPIDLGLGEPKRRKKVVFHSQNMAPGARPFVILGRFHQFRPEGIALYVTYGLECVIFIHGIRNEPALPEIASPVVRMVDHGRIFAMDLADPPGKAFGPVRDGDEMDMIIHQAVAPDIEAMPMAFIFQYVKIKLLVVIREKNRIPAIAALNDMVRDPGDYDPM